MGQCDICGFLVPPENDVVSLEKLVYFLDCGDEPIGAGSKMFGKNPPVEILGLEFITKNNKDASRHLEPVLSGSGEVVCSGDRNRLKVISGDPALDDKFPELPLSRNRMSQYKLAYVLLKKLPISGPRIEIKFRK